MIKLGLMGCGRWGINLFRNILKLKGAKLKWVCDIDLIRLHEINDKYPDIHTTQIYQEILNDPEVDGIIIATPPMMHYEMTKHSLIASKHTFTEKPLALNSTHADELVQLSEQSKKILMVGHLLRYHPAIIKLKHLIQEGDLGDIFYLYSQRLNLGIIRRYENALWNLGCHDVSVALHLLDEYPEAVSAMGQCYAQETVEDTVFLNLHFKKKMAHIHVSWLDPHKIRRLTLVGNKRMAVFDDMQEQKITLYDKGFVITKDDDLNVPIELREGSPIHPKVSTEEPLRLELQHFVDCIQNRTSPLTDAREGAAVVKILEIAQRSLERKSIPIPIKWQPSLLTTVS